MWMGEKTRKFYYFKEEESSAANLGKAHVSNMAIASET